MKGWILSAIVLAAVVGGVDGRAAEGPEPSPDRQQPDKLRPGERMRLFDGRTLAGWKVTDFGGQGEVRVEDGQLILEFGSPMTGVTWQRSFPKTDYEVELDAMRVDGDDFFCGLTFPVGEAPCSLILGGWGGATVGLSSIDGQDASDNETTSYQEFKPRQWYHVRLRVTPERIECWLDKQKIADVELAGKKISIRPEVELSRPFGIATWVTTGAIKNITLLRLDPQRR